MAIWFSAGRRFVAPREAAPEEVEAVLRRIQFFDPVGVAARDLRECLLIQLENLQLSDSLAARIIADYLNFLESKRYEKLAKDLGVTIDEIADAAHLIASLEPKPSRGFEQDEVARFCRMFSSRKSATNM